MLRRSIAILLVLTLLPIANVQAQDPTAFIWPQHDDVSQALQEAAEQSEWITLHSVGASGQEKDLLLVEITDPTSSTPMAERVVTLITTQQHGNEPAGTPAALQLLDDMIAGGPITQTLQDQVLLLWPQANPDGAAANTRANANSADLNRRHVHLDEPEVVALHSVIMQQWDVHVGMDHHEYSGTGLGYPVPVRSYDFDATILYPRHGNVRAPTMDHSVELYDHLVAGLESDGYTAGEYGVQTVAGVPVSHIAGGPDPGILRNNFGLNNVVGLLVESFVNSGNPLVTPERRIDVHYQVMQDTLAFTSDHAADLIAAKRASERLNLDQPLTDYIEEWPVDPVTGEANAGNIRGPLAPAYRTPEDINAVLLGHGLPAAIPDGNGWIVVTADERQGLLGAILEPLSTRNVVDGEALTHADIPASYHNDGGDDSKDTPAPMAAPLLVLALAFLVRKSRM